MKKVISLILALALCLSLCACGNNTDVPVSSDKETSKTGSEVTTSSQASDTDNDLSQFPFIGTWADDEGKVYLRIQDDGKICSESIVTNKSSSTTNGVTTTNTTKSVLKSEFKWKVENGNFMFNGLTAYTPHEENGNYSLVSEKMVYYRVGDLDYTIPLEDESDGNNKDILTDSAEYALGDIIKAEGFELTLTETGITPDIRISSESTGIKITAGPSVESGKQYVYLKGTLKNTGTTSTRTAIGGVIYLDDYEFILRTDTISTAGSPKSAIDPLETVHILLYAQITDEMVSQFAEGKIIFGFNDGFTDVQLEQAQYLYYVRVTR